MLESKMIWPDARSGVSSITVLLPSNKKRKESSSSTDHDAEYPIDVVVNLESAMVNLPYDDDDYPPEISPPPAVRLSNRCRTKPDLKVYVDEAWELLKPALTSILHDEEEELDRYSFATINQAVEKACWYQSSREAVSDLILEVCGTYISTTLQSLALHCNDDDADPSLLLLPLEKFWLEFPKKFGHICDIVGVGRLKLWGSGLKLLPTNLFLFPQVCDKVRTIILHLIKDQRLGKPVNISQLKNLMAMLCVDPFRELRFLEKPFLDSTAEFYAAEAKQVLEQSSDLSLYLEHANRRVGEEKKKCRSLPLFFVFQDELLEVVNKELLGVHACAILEKGFEKLMDDRHFEALRIMYDLFSQADFVGHINDALSSYVCKTGEKILKEEGSSLAEFKAHVDKICCTYFSEDPLLEKTAQKCFQGLGMSVVSPMLYDPFTEEMSELGISVPFLTSHHCFFFN